jgi:plasmid stabilization system protein ParE
MRIVWSPAGWADIDRLHAFLVEHDIDAADAVFDKLANAPTALLGFPRLGSRLSRFDPREIREFRVAGYLLRYELAGADIFVLRFFHAREDRS